jgi:hypothetical protein
MAAKVERSFSRKKRPGTFLSCPVLGTRIYSPPLQVVRPRGSLKVSFTVSSSEWRTGMSQKLRRLVTCASLVGVAIALMSAGPAAQQPQAFPSQEAIQRAQEAYQAEKQREAIARDKSGVVEQLMDRWHKNIETEKAREGFEAAFMGASPEKLLQLT